LPSAGAEWDALATVRAIDDLARSLAVRSAHGSADDGLRADARDLPFERMARAVARPMSRRRALQVAAAAGATSFLTLRTGTAYAACPSCPRTSDPPSFTQFCGHTRGVGCLFVCCPADYHCCQTDTVVVCCKAEQKCGPIVNGGYTCVCNDEHQCGEFCCTDNQLCVEFDPEDDPMDATCVPDCGTEMSLCDDLETCCDDSERESCCGHGCCSANEECCASGRYHEEWCCPSSYGCSFKTPGVCVCSSSQKCGDQCCERGSVCCTGLDIVDRPTRQQGCCAPTQLDELLDSLLSFTSGGAGGSAAASAAARPRASASPGAADALVALRAVAGLAVLTHETIRVARPDSRFRRAVRAPRVALKAVAPGPGLDPASADALTKLLAAEARAWALVYAAAVARGRSIGAIKARRKKQALAQARAAGAFAGKAAKAIRRIPGLRAAALAAFQAGGVAEVSVSYRDARAFQAAVHHTGLPADLAARLAQLGLTTAQRRQIAKLIWNRPTERLTGAQLIEPLADPVRTAALRALTKRLGRLAAKSRRQPISRSRARPGKVRANRPHASASARARARGSR
jgi:hypothetical protein